jgi:hypothetical protein
MMVSNRWGMKMFFDQVQEELEVEFNGRYDSYIDHVEWLAEEAAFVAAFIGSRLPRPDFDADV